MRLVELANWMSVHGQEFNKFLQKRNKQHHAKQTVTVAAQRVLHEFVDAYRTHTSVTCLDKRLVQDKHLPYRIRPSQRQLYTDLLLCIEKGFWNLDVAVVELRLDHPVCSACVCTTLCTTLCTTPCAVALCAR